MRTKTFFHTSFSLKPVVIFIFFLTISKSLSAQTEIVDSVLVDTSYTSESEEALPEFDRLVPYDTTRFQSHYLPDSVVERLKKDEAFWYANLAPKQKEEKKQEAAPPAGEPFFVKQWFRTLIWILIIGGFIAVLIWFLIASDVRLFRKKPSIIHSVSDDELPEDIFSISYERELDQALANKNFRLGVRLMYLHILKLLADKDFIEYKIERTNSDYLAQLYNSEYYKDFFLLTRHFEYVWYGKFSLSDTAFEAIRQEYLTLKNRLQS